MIPFERCVGQARPLNPTFAHDGKAVEQGVHLSALDQFSKYSGLSLRALLEVVIPARTLKHRKQREEPLSSEEADRLRRVARTYELGLKSVVAPLTWNYRLSPLHPQANHVRIVSVLEETFDARLFQSRPR